MKRPAEGQIHELISAIAIVDYPAYLVRGRDRTLMIDSGINHLGPLYLASIRDSLGRWRAARLPLLHPFALRPHRVGGLSEAQPPRPAAGRSRASGRPGAEAVGARHHEPPQREP